MYPEGSDPSRIPGVIDLRERVAVVTGAGRGIGRAYALRLAAYGARVVVNDAGVATDGGATDEDPAAEVVAEIVAAGGEAVAHRGDIGDAAVGNALVSLALETWDRLDIVVNNAGFGRPRMSFNLSDDEWDDVIRVHLRGTFVVSRPACRHWRAQAKEHGTHLRTSDQHRDRVVALRRRGAVELCGCEGRDQRVHRGGRDRDGAVRCDGQRDHARSQHAARADRLADGSGDRPGRRHGRRVRPTRPGARRGVRLFPRIAMPRRASPGRPTRSTAARSSTSARGASSTPGGAPTAASPPTSSRPSSRSTPRPSPPTDHLPSGPPPAAPPIAPTDGAIEVLCVPR